MIVKWFKRYVLCEFLVTTYTRFPVRDVALIGSIKDCPKLGHNYAGVFRTTPERDLNQGELK